MPLQTAFSYELETSPDDSGWKRTVIHCRGRLISEGTPLLRELVQPLIVQGGQVVLDLGELDYLDSSGLGALVGLKVSSINRGHCKLELINLSPRTRKLLTITNLLPLFSD